MWLVLPVILIVLSVAYWRFMKRYDFARDIPLSQKHYPLIGCANLFVGKNEAQRFLATQKIFHSNQNIVRLFLGPQMILGTSHPDVVQSIMTDPMWLEKPFFYKFFDVGHGLFGAKVDLWKAQRKALNSAFNTKILQSFIPIFIEFSKKLVDRMDAVPEGSTINMMDQASRCTLEMVVATTVGFDANSFEQVEILGSKVEQRMFDVHYYSDAIFRWTKSYRELKTLRKYLDAYVAQVIDDKSKYFQNLPADRSEPEDIKKPQIFVNELFTNKLKQFSPVEIADNIFTIVGAGTDTSATTIAYCCLNLGFFPDIQQKLYEEVMRVYPEDEPDITVESLKELEYMELVLKETLRLYPIGPVLIRQSVGDSIIEGVKIPAGNLFAMHVFNLHRRTDVWGPDAEQFVPERFAPDRLKKVHPFAFQGFSGGSRNCIGGRYAIMSMKIMMVYIMKKFRIKTKLRVEELQFRFEAILRTESGQLIELEKR